MTPREVVLAQINHEETHPVPYTFGCEDAELSRQLQEHYGSETWQKLFIPYIVGVGGIDSILQRQIDDTYARDGFGTIWRMDRRPWRLEEPGMKQLSFEGYDFPTPEKFVNPNLKENAEKAMAAHPESFSIIHFGTPQEIRDEVRRLVKEMGKGGGYILAPAKGLQPGTPLENAIAVVDAFTNQEG